MSNTRWRRALRRSVTVIAGTTVLTMVGAGAAFAFNSPGKPPAVGDQTITWTGQGANGGVLNTSLCDAANDPLGPNQPYLLWILDTDHGSVTTGPTTPALTLSGSGSGTYYQSAPFTSNNVHIVTPYYPPDSSLLASAAMNITDVGTGSWQLVISHGCAGNTPPPPAGALTATKTANGNYDTTYKWDIAKAADKTQINTSDGSATFGYTVTVHHDGGTPSGWRVTGNIDVHNPNSADANITGVTDTLSDGTSCNVDLGNGLTIPAYGDTIYPYSCSLSGQPAAPLNNDATVTWPDQPLAGTSGLAGGSADAIVNGISFTQDKVFDGQVSVSDTLGGDLGPVGLGDANPTYLTYTHTFSGDPAGTCTSHDNMATFTTNTSSTTGSASQTVKQCVGADLAVSKHATPSFDRTYAWNIAKSVDKTKVNQVGGNATFNYTVSVGHDNGTDGNWQVAGKITVANPNDWEQVTVNVTDAIDNGGTCTVSQSAGGDDPANAVIPASGSVDFPYTCSYGSAPSPASGTNTATATWSKDAASTPDGSAQGQAPADFGSVSPNIKDGSVTVTDTQGGTLGTVGLSDPNPKALAYSKSFPVPANGCQSYDNTATFTTNTTNTSGNSNKVTVSVCGPAKTGALTMGFWQNKNGQGIITGGVSTAGVCNSGTWLRQYLPFQDLSNAATCAQVGTYVTNIIKAAGAAGTSMNPMLKAQMLSTALDVYFSDPALGTNKIGAPGPVGAVSIDLTQICKMIDGSGGTATCSGTYENAGPAFGGAASLKVRDMLTYAASQSNVGGSAWYAQVKATQQLAKDAFDAINNQVAFGA